MTPVVMAENAERVEMDASSDVERVQVTCPHTGYATTSENFNNFQQSAGNA